MAWRKLQWAAGESTPRRIIILACETLPHAIDKDTRRTTHLFRLGCAVKWRSRGGKRSAVEVLRFDKPESFWQFVIDGSNAKEITWIVSHNALHHLRLVDLQGITDADIWAIDKPRVPNDPASESTANRGGRALAVLEAPPIILCLKHQASGVKIVCVDILNWVAAPLEKLAEAVAAPLPPTPRLTALDGPWFDLAEHKAAVIGKVFSRLVGFVKSHKLGNFCKTSASQAMTAFRHRFLRFEIVLHDEDKVQDLERSAFFGGRCELWKYGKADCRVHQYDVSALYPFVMASHLLPSKLLRWESREEPQELFPNCDWQRTVAEVMIRPKLENYPMRTAKGTIYPLGEFKTTLCGGELAAAMAKGEVLAVGSWAEYRTDPIFRRYIETLWKLRKHYQACGDALEAKLCKLLCNSLFGKFGQKSIKWEDKPESIAVGSWRCWSTYWAETGLREDFRSVGWHVQKKSTQGNTRGSFVAIAAFVTALAREHMNGLRETAGESNVFYQGIDSLVVNDAGRHRLSQAGEIHPEHFGRLRWQRTESQSAFWGVNDYVMGNEQIISGIKPADLRHGGGRYSGERSMASGELFADEKRPGVDSVAIEFGRSQDYWKREINDDGSTTPIHA